MSTSASGTFDTSVSFIEWFIVLELDVPGLGQNMYLTSNTYCADLFGLPPLPLPFPATGPDQLYSSVCTCSFLPLFSHPDWCLWAGIPPDWPNLVNWSTWYFVVVLGDLLPQRALLASGHRPCVNVTRYLLLLLQLVGWSSFSCHLLARAGVKSNLWPSLVSLGHTVKPTLIALATESRELIHHPHWEDWVISSSVLIKEIWFCGPHRCWQLWYACCCLLQLLLLCVYMPLLCPVIVVATVVAAVLPLISEVPYMGPTVGYVKMSNYVKQCFLNEARTAFHIMHQRIGVIFFSQWNFWMNMDVLSFVSLWGVKGPFAMGGRGGGNFNFIGIVYLGTTSDLFKASWSHHVHQLR